MLIIQAKAVLIPPALTTISQLQIEYRVKGRSERYLWNDKKPTDRLVHSSALTISR